MEALTPTSTGLFSCWDASGLQEDAPTESTCQWIPRRVQTAATWYTLCSCTHTCTHPCEHNILFSSCIIALTVLLSAHACTPWCEKEVYTQIFTTWVQTYNIQQTNRHVLMLMRHTCTGIFLPLHSFVILLFNSYLWVTWATLADKDTHTQREWRPWDLLMLFAAAVLWIHKRPCGTPGENGALGVPFVKMSGKCARGLAMQLKGD